ncbi:MAG TPA: hypothetical protein VG710_17900 [Opitutus sp.]|nr:hypothetical protein [Opitutus sp.]
MLVLHLATVGAVTKPRDASYTAKKGPKAGQVINQFEAVVMGVAEDGRQASVRVTGETEKAVQDKLGKLKVGAPATIQVWGEMMQGGHALRAV